MKNLIIFTLCLFTAQVVHAQQAHLSIDGQTRYLQDSEAVKTGQYNLTIKGSFSPGGVITIHSLAQTGGQYFAGFGNLYDFNEGELTEEHKLYLKRLYLEARFLDGDLNVQAGAMGTRSSLATATKLGNNGWIDGARATLQTKLGEIVVSAGQLNPNKMNFWGRAADPELNYFEIVMNGQIMEKLLAEGGVEVFDGKVFLQAASAYELEVATGRVLKLVADAKVQTDNGSFRVAGGVKDLISLVRGQNSQVKLDVNYEYVHADFDQDMFALSNPMHRGYTGGAVVFKGSFPVSKKWGIQGITNIRVGNDMNDFRLQVGIKKNLFEGSSKRRKRRNK